MVFSTQNEWCTALILRDHIWVLYTTQNEWTWYLKWVELTTHFEWNLPLTVRGKFHSKWVPPLLKMSGILISYRVEYSTRTHYEWDFPLDSTQYEGNFALILRDHIWVLYSTRPLKMSSECSTPLNYSIWVEQSSHSEENSALKMSGIYHSLNMSAEFHSDM